MKAKLIKGAAAGIVVVAVAVGGVLGYKALFSSKPAASASSTYTTAVARKMNLTVSIQGTGSAYAATSKEITANNSGEIKSLSVNVGDTVTAGDKLFVVDSEQLKENLTKAQNNLEKQKLQLAKLKADLEKANQIPENGGAEKAASLTEDISVQNLAISDAEKAVATAQDQINKMTVKAPISGTVVAKNNITGDTVQAGKAVLTVVDTTDLRIKMAVDELDISKVVKGQKTEIKFDAIKDKVYEGAVEVIGITGNTSNNVTTYDVIVSVKNPEGIRLGMNGNVNILVESKENALVIPAEALVENNGKKYVMVPQAAGGTTNGNGTQQPGTQNNQGATGNTQGTQNNQGTRNNQGGYSQAAGGNIQRQRPAGGGYSGAGRLVEIKTGLENENYIEVLEGVTEGQQLLIALPQSTTTTTNNNRNNMGGFGNFGGGAAGGMRPQGTGGGQR